MERVTLKMIAERAGVSVASVSLALRGRGALSKTRVESIRKLAEELGYQPNPLLSSIAAKRFRSFQAVSGTPLAIFSFPTMPGYPLSRVNNIPEIVKEARSLGYAPTVYEFPEAAEGGEIARILHHRMVQGIISVGSLDMQALGEDFDWSPYSVVQCGRFDNPHPFHTVRANIFQAIKLVFTELRDRGYKRIGFAVGRHNTPMEDDEARYGAAVAMETAYLPEESRLPVYRGNIGNAEAFLEWVASNRPDAVVGFSEGFYWYLTGRGYRIPEELGFATLHLHNLEDRQCSGLIQNTPEIARQSVMLIDQLIRNRERGVSGQPMHLLIPSTWSDGGSLRQTEKPL